jgi:YegS/Rv2252/BmrU family lipid kinase
MLSLIVNPAAGGGRAGAALPAVQDALTALELPHRVDATSSLVHAAELARRAVEQGDSPVAFGGDGLVGAVAGELRGHPVAMGILPGGRGNDFARVLGIPRDPVRACGVLAAGRERRIDLGLVGERPFVGIASCGFDSAANRIANRSRRVPAGLVYLYGGLGALARWTPARFRITVDGESVDMRGYTVAVANSSTYGGGMRLAPDAALDDGLFDVVLIADLPRPVFLLRLAEVFRGSHVRLDNVRVLRAREVEISAERPFTLYADGDPVAELPVRLRVDPGAVTVRVPV